MSGDRYPFSRRVSDRSIEIIDNLIAQAPEAKLEKPQRVRAIIFNPSATELLLILRERPGTAPYAVFPGGGVELYDASPIDALSRELAEELSIDPSGVDFSRGFMEFDNQWMFVGRSRQYYDALHFAGPELLEPEEINGIFVPGWVDVNQLNAVNLVPIEIRQMILDSRRTDG